MATKVREKIIQDLKNEIARGILGSGQRLTESSLCVRYRVGRTVVREALRHLEQEGFIIISQNVGAVVRELTQKDIEHIYDLLGTLEGLSVRIGTAYVTHDKIKQLEDLLAKMDNARDPTEFFNNNFEFHTQLTSLTDNPRLMRFMEILRTQATRISLRSFFNPGQITASVSEHRKILDAIQNTNSVKAERLVREHYLLSKNRLIKYLNSSL